MVHEVVSLLLTIGGLAALGSATTLVLSNRSKRRRAKSEISRFLQKIGVNRGHPRVDLRFDSWWEGATDELVRLPKPLTKKDLALLGIGVAGVGGGIALDAAGGGGLASWILQSLGVGDLAVEGIQKWRDRKKAVDAYDRWHGVEKELDADPKIVQPPPVQPSKPERKSRTRKFFRKFKFWGRKEESP